MSYSGPISACMHQDNMGKPFKLSEVQLLLSTNEDNYICPANFRGLLLESNIKGF